MGKVSYILACVPGVLKMIKIGVANLLILYLSLGYGVVRLPSDFKENTLFCIKILGISLIGTILFQIGIDIYLLEEHVKNPEIT